MHRKWLCVYPCKVRTCSVAHSQHDGATTEGVHVCTPAMSRFLRAGLHAAVSSIASYAYLPSNVSWPLEHLEFPQATSHESNTTHRIMVSWRCFISNSCSFLSHVFIPQRILLGKALVHLSWRQSSTLVLLLCRLCCQGFCVWLDAEKTQGFLNGTTGKHACPPTGIVSYTWDASPSQHSRADQGST